MGLHFFLGFFQVITWQDKLEFILEHCVQTSEELAKEAEQRAEQEKQRADVAQRRAAQLEAQLRSLARISIGISSISSADLISQRADLGC